LHFPPFFVCSLWESFFNASYYSTSALACQGGKAKFFCFFKFITALSLKISVFLVFPHFSSFSILKIYFLIFCKQKSGVKKD